MNQYNVVKVGSLYSKYKAALWVGIALAAIQQLTGINIVMYYAPQVFKVQGDWAATLSLIAMLINFVFTIASIFMADSSSYLIFSYRFGKKVFAHCRIHWVYNWLVCMLPNMHWNNPSLFHFL